MQKYLWACLVLISQQAFAGYVSLSPVDFKISFPGSNMVRPNYLSGQALSFSFDPTAAKGSVRLIAAAHLPHGAVISGFECYTKDSDELVDIDAGSQAVLKRLNPLADDLGLASYLELSVAELSDAADMGISAHRGSKIIASGADVNNEEHHYVVEVAMKLSPKVMAEENDFSTIQFRGCRVSYY